MLRALLALPLALALTACGDGSSGRDVVRDAAENLSTIQSGIVHAKLVVEPEPRGSGHPYGFTIDGPFHFGDRPTASVAYTQVAKGRRDKLVLGANEGYVVGDGTRRALHASELAGLRQTVRAVRAGGSFLDLAGWLTSSKSTDCPDAGTTVVCAEGELDRLQAATGLLTLAQAVGTPSGNPTIQNADPEQIRNAVKKATYLVMVGKDDRLLRDLRIDLELAADVPESLRGFFGRLIAANARFELRVDRPKAAR
jgi:hypothetical protein